jgi:antagonist of KipI
MSLRIIKAGLLDTIQDTGRWGFQHLGINPGGAMDRFSSQLANALLGRDLHAPVIELHFPAAQILFTKAAVICLTGANFSPVINGRPVPINHPIAVAENSVLGFTHHNSGCRAYLSVANGLKLEPWLGSYSTHLKAACGGLSGRSLRQHDEIFFEEEQIGNFGSVNDFSILHWKAMEVVDSRTEIEFIFGSEWGWLTEASKQAFETGWHQLTAATDRMGYRLAGQQLKTTSSEQLVSSGVCFGTVQLLPDGQLILLMADHQTTGGYPRIAQVISAHLPLLAQKKPNDIIRFKLTSLKAAQEKLVAQKKYLQQLQIACKLKMEQLHKG